MRYDAVIVGGGPGGLHCAKILAQNGVKTAVLERNRKIGRKVCAGGITWSGLMNEVPEHLIQNIFHHLTIRTLLQSNTLRSDQPMLATVNRLELGSYMAQQAQDAGADIYAGALMEHIDSDTVYYRFQEKKHQLRYDYLVGADGSHSKVRTYLGIDCGKMLTGIAMHYLVEYGDVKSEDMIWNFNPWSFGSGYSWIFPHRDHLSVGAYLADGTISPQDLKKNLDTWLARQQIDTTTMRFEAEKIQIGFSGWSFDKCFLVGDAAGLASPLTGEGINPAIISGEAAALKILNESYEAKKLEQLISRHQKHSFMVKTASRGRLVALILSELCAALLRCRLVSFKKFEMA